MGLCEIGRNGLFLYFYLEKGEEAQLLGVFPEKTKLCEKKREAGACRVADVLSPGRKNYSFRGGKTFYDTPAYLFVAEEFRWIGENCFEIVQRSQQGELMVRTYYTFSEKAPVVSCKSVLENRSEKEITIDGITSFCLGEIGHYEKGVSNPSEELEVCYVHNTWSEECRVVRRKLKDVGVWAYGNLSYDRFRIGNHSGFSSGEYLPVGAAYDTKADSTLMWQIESSGAWAFEIGCFIPGYCESFLQKEYRQQIYLQLFGPDMESAGWYKTLTPGERFESVPAAVTCVRGTPEDAAGAFALYRREKRRITKLPVIFNDYMNCFMGDSTTEKLLPLIDQAAQAGCEIFVIDCGWYDAGDWQYTFGEFEECRERYPGGLSEVTERIRSRGMRPGIWLELESVGVDCAALRSMPKEWLFTRHGEPVVDSGRVHLDFRVREVRERASAILKRVVTKYGLGYIKIDYNLELSFGTERYADSPADGLLQHNRAYLEWFSGERNKYPEVIFENCGSGGLRMDYAMLSRMDIQSVSDQEDYRIMAVIAANSAVAVLPEQAGVWAYPLAGAEAKECVMNMASAMLQRIHLGGRLDRLSRESFNAVKEGIDCYKRIREEIPDGIPFWPLGFHAFDAGWLAFGLHLAGRDLLTVCRREDEREQITLSLGREAEHAAVLYPAKSDLTVIRREKDTDRIDVRLPSRNSAGILEIRYSDSRD
ncbi:MAG: alpha-galactosidase [Lachnospiraceae bacterium]|nr:alpha-galactosidase [Lachnospiraceae bacterium]